jgi:hypothetical protein
VQTRRFAKPTGAAVGLLVVALVMVAAAAAGPAARGSAVVTRGDHGGDSGPAQHYDVSPPLRDLAPAPPIEPDKKKEKEPKKGPPIPAASSTPDPVAQTSIGAADAPALGAGFDGVGQGFTGPSGTFTVNSAPPDTNGAVGPSHYVQIVNSAFAVFNKSGTPLYGPVQTNTLWSGFGGGCQSNNDGDATVAYDRAANRWIVSQFSVSTTPYLQCVAVSTTGDPTGSYARYSFQYANFPDYPKLGVWPDAYYTTFNMFRNGTTFAGPEVCAYDRAKMLLGQAATQQCFTLASTFGALLPSDLDSATAPPPGSPNYVVSFDTNVLQLWKFHVDWTTPASSTFTGPATIPVAAFSPACAGGTCIPQSGTTQRLDSLADRLMYRLAYRNFGDHESLLVNDSVTAGSSVGVRWYELRSPSGTPTVYQQGTYAPDATYRWMGSIAMDGNGNIGLGYSTSSSTLKPGIRYTGRLAGDALGMMTQGEGVLVSGTGAQNGGLSRWGDYSSMSIDPADDCTFWLTSEYLTGNGSFNWHTRIGSFKFPDCGSNTSSDFSISAAPSSVSAAQGTSTTSTVSTAVTSGSAQTVTLSASGQPSGTTVSFNPASVSAGGSSTMTVAVGGLTTPGQYTITVTGTGATATHTTSVSLTVTAAPVSDFSLTASPSSVTAVQGDTATSTISTAVTTGSAQTVSLSASGQPAGTTVTFNPASVTAGGSSTMSVAVGSTTAPGTYTITVTGTGTSATHTAAVSLTVTVPQNVVNGGFETGTLSGWTTSGVYTPVVSTTAHSGSYAARIGSPSPVNGNSTLTQTVAVPTGNTQLTFWYQPHCTDTITYDQIQMQIRSTAGATLATVMNVCSNSGVWTSITFDTTAWAGQTVVLWFNDHDDGYATDPTYFLLDDVAITTYTPATTGVLNPGFETGTLSSWSASGAFVPVVTTSPHTGSYSARIGSTGPVNGNSTLTQTVAVPAGSSTLSFWYRPFCTDTIVYDQIQMQIRSTTGGTLATVLNVCSNSGAWTNATFNTTAYAGQTVVLWFNDHDDGWATDPTYFLLDDVTLG